MVEGRKNQAIINSLKPMAQSLQNQQGLEDELCGLGKFQRSNQPNYKGRYDPEGAQTWLREIEKIFRVMALTEEQKVLFGTYKLSEEAEDQWDNVCQMMEDEFTEIIRNVFKTNYLEKYFLEDMCNKKEIEFLELKKGNSKVVEYVAKFKELVKFCPHYISIEVEGQKCIKIESGFLLEIKQAIGY